jgi:hypothetical protein
VFSGLTASFAYGSVLIAAPVALTGTLACSIAAVTRRSTGRSPGPYDLLVMA